MAPRYRTRRIGFIGYDGITALDLIGPSEVFATANALIKAARTGSTELVYELIVLGVSARRTFTAESGMTLVPDQSLDTAALLDTLVVPGGCGLREPAQLKRVSQWLSERHQTIRRIASVCTGIYALAEAGLLDGCTVTTHWRHADAVARQYPNVHVYADAIFIRQGRFYTSAGVTAGIDLALALVEEDHGPQVALLVAKELVVYLKRTGGQSQFSDRLTFQTDTGGRLAELAAWMQDHLADDLSVEHLANRCHISPRQLSRRFKLAFGMSPAACVERMRAEEAGHLLVAQNTSIESIAEIVGFRSVDVFRRAFERRFGIAPSQFRARFRTTSKDKK